MTGPVARAFIVAGRRCVFRSVDPAIGDSLFADLYPYRVNGSTDSIEPADIALTVSCSAEEVESPALQAAFEVGTIGDSAWSVALDIPGAIGRLCYEDGVLYGKLALDIADSFGLMAALRVALALHTEQSGGLLLHAAGVWRNDRVWVFCGPSGAGKTTIATALNDCGRLFSADEMVLTFDADGALWAHVTPFGDDRRHLPAPTVGPVAGILLIQQDIEHALHALSALSTTAVLLRESRWFTRNVGASAAALATVDRLISLHICRGLRFRRDPGFWALIDSI